MFDTMTLTKATGAVCGSLLVFLFANWAAESLYNTAPSSHGGEEAAQAYTIDTGAAEGGEATADAGPSFEEVFAAADPAAGEKVFGKCKACHKIDGANATGPHLNGVVGRNHAAIADFAYSDAMKGKASEVWTPDVLNTFLTSPKAAVPGTKMTFAGLPKAEDRANLIAYLATLK
ncbi:c-type cytochrome [Fuscibacter oryzae]|uniref:Cytochrome c family protein n=1 Tax=Fuscibacter oryzae TaxID=2803939 RepID=A0A8J7MLW8_9RHOB|nr:cytochrome c family protein [Fuscibacter oryzae]MBL4926562.1 cytochrome c family protein [Fuscibacter oryzae]